jgi:hypothetical protein
LVASETGNMVCDPILSKRPPPRICRLFSPLASERGSFDGKSKDIMGYPHLCGVHWRVFRLPLHLSRDEMVCDPTSSWTIFLAPWFLSPCTARHHWAPEARHERPPRGISHRGPKIGIVPEDKKVGMASGGPCTGPPLVPHVVVGHARAPQRALRS